MVDASQGNTELPQSTPERPLTRRQLRALEQQQLEDTRRSSNVETHEGASLTEETPYGTVPSGPARSWGSTSVQIGTPEPAEAPRLRADEPTPAREEVARREAEQVWDRPVRSSSTPSPVEPPQIEAENDTIALDRPVAGAFSDEKLSAGSEDYTGLLTENPSTAAPVAANQHRNASTGTGVAFSQEEFSAVSGKPTFQDLRKGFEPPRRSGGLLDPETGAIPVQKPKKSSAKKAFAHIGASILGVLTILALLVTVAAGYLLSTTLSEGKGYAVATGSDGVQAVQYSTPDTYAGTLRIVHKLPESGDVQYLDVETVTAEDGALTFKPLVEGAADESATLTILGTVDQDVSVPDFIPAFGELNVLILAVGAVFSLLILGVLWVLAIRSARSK